MQTIKINSIDEPDTRLNMQNMGEMEESGVESVQGTAAKKNKYVVISPWSLV